MKTYSTTIAIAIASLFALASCSEEIYLNENSDTTTTTTTEAELSPQEQDAFSKAYAKLPLLYKSVYNGKKFSSSDIPAVADSYPLWYGDTSITIDPNQPGVNPGIIDPGSNVAAKDSIYAYCFNFADEQGSMIIGVDDDMPDLIMYSYGYNFFNGPKKTPGNTTSEESQRWKEFLEHVHQIHEMREKIIRSLIADYAVEYKSKVSWAVDTYSKMVAEWGTQGLNIPRIIRRDTIQNWTTIKKFKYQNGMIPISLYNTQPFTSEIHRVYGTNANC